MFLTLFSYLIMAGHRGSFYDRNLDTPAEKIGERFDRKITDKKSNPIITIVVTYQSSRGVDN
jgi:hypothetical protein